MYWDDARLSCFKHEADLASFPNNTLNVVKEYLERIQVRLIGAKTVSVGLIRVGQLWKWLNGERFSGNMTSFRVPKGRLVWVNDKNDWVLKDTKDPRYRYAEEESDLYFCEKLRGESTLSTSLFR